MVYRIATKKRKVAVTIGDDGVISWEESTKNMLKGLITDDDLRK